MYCYLQSLMGMVPVQNNQNPFVQQQQQRPQPQPVILNLGNLPAFNAEAIGQVQDVIDIILWFRLSRTTCILGDIYDNDDTIFLYFLFCLLIQKRILLLLNPSSFLRKVHE